MKRLMCFAIIFISVILSESAGAVPGVTDTEIKIGTVTDLSGPTAIWGVPWTNGMRMRFEEANEVGGINGRKFTLLVEDGKYQVPLMVKAANRLIKRDNVFGFLGMQGTPGSLAIRPLVENSGRFSLFPCSGAKSMSEPLHPEHFNYLLGNPYHIRGAMKYMKDKFNIKTACAQCQESDYGKEMEEEFISTAKDLGLETPYVGQHKPTEVEFAGTATAIKNAGCDMLVMGTIVKDTIGLYLTLRKIGYKNPAVSNIVPYMPLVAAAGNGGMEGYYVAGPMLKADFANSTDPFIQDFGKKYKEKYGEEPAIQAQVAYVSTGIFIEAIERCGKELTKDNMFKQLEGIKDYNDPFGGPKISFGPKKHYGTDELLLFQVQDSKWKLITRDLEHDF